ncbi:MAG: hypothetical protein K6B70_03330 [Clostridia bacterium]|nr:hypothetical protein [Clostridia bacterium]
MSNLRKVNDDILKEWFKFREETCFCITDDEDKRHKINFEEIGNRILKTVPSQNQKYVKSQLELLDNNLFDYVTYWNEKYYRNGFCDGVQVIIGSYIE